MTNKRFLHLSIALAMFLLFPAQILSEPSLSPVVLNLIKLTLLILGTAHLILGIKKNEC